MTARSSFEQSAISDNIISQIRELQQRISALEAGSFEAVLTAGVDLVGERVIATSDPLNADPSSAGFSGTFMSAVPVTISDGNVAHFAEVSAGTAQFWVYQGAARAGQGAVKLDADGLSILGSDTDVNKVKFVTSDGTILSHLLGFSLAGTNYSALTALSQTDQDSHAQIIADAPSGKTSKVSLYSRIGSVIGGGIDVTATSGLVGSVVINESGQDVDTRIEGNTDENLFLADAGLDAIGIGGVAESGYKFKVTGNQKITGSLNYANAGTLTINGGTITKTGTRHIVDTQGGTATTDDLDTILGGVDGDILILSNAVSARDVTYKDATGNLR